MADLKNILNPNEKENEINDFDVYSILLSLSNPVHHQDNNNLLIKPIEIIEKEEVQISNKRKFNDISSNGKLFFVQQKKKLISNLQTKLIIFFFISDNSDILSQLKKSKFFLPSSMGFNLQEHAVVVPSKAPVKPSSFDANKFDTKKVEKLFKKGSLVTDITSLLTLPQKVAAAKLGISESMLCKRFKESTNRKWPYRNLRKLDRQISCSSDNIELGELKVEKETSLAPVSIRIRRYRTQEEVDKICSSLTDDKSLDKYIEDN